MNHAVNFLIIKNQTEGDTKWFHNPKSTKIHMQMYMREKKKFGTVTHVPRKRRENPQASRESQNAP